MGSEARARIRAQSGDYRFTSAGYRAMAKAGKLKQTVTVFASPAHAPACRCPGSAARLKFMQGRRNTWRLGTPTMTEGNSTNILLEDLIPSLAGGSQASRRYAAKMLGIEWPEHLGSFFMEFMENGAVPVRQAVAETLGRLYGMNRNQFNLPGPEGLSDLPYLACLLRGIGDPDGTTRVNSARSLGNLKGEDQALQALTGHCQTRPRRLGRKPRGAWEFTTTPRRRHP